MHEKLQDLLKLTGDRQFPDGSELHGVLCAHALRPQTASSADELARWLDVPAGQHGELAAALAEEHAALTAGNMDYQLYLPGDSADLTLRTQSLAAWCGGFVSGIGVYEDWLPEAPAIAGSGPRQSSDADVREALADLTQIARAGLENESGSEAEEQAFAELVEYVRVAVQLIQNALQQPAGQAGPPPVLH